MKEFKWFLIILVGLGIVWFFSGGPERASSKDPFIHQPAPVGEGGTYGFFNSFRTPYTEKSPSQAYETSSSGWAVINPYGNTTQKNSSTGEPLTGKSLEVSESLELSASSARSSEPSSEYLTIRVSDSAKEDIIFDDWTLRSAVTGASVSIAKASYLPRLGAVNEEQTVRAKPGDVLTIITGRSPIGASFRLNKCTGYLSQFQRFYPSIPRQCPRPIDEIPAEFVYGSNPNAFNDACIDFIERIGVCRINTQDIPLSMQSQCQEFVTKSLNYNSCVSKHSNEPDFYENEWRIYLKRDAELWKDRREIIELVDPTGVVISTVSY